MGNLSRAGVARSGIDLLDLAALGQLPDQGVLPPAAAYNQYLQRFAPGVIFINLTPCIPLSSLGEGEKV